MIDNELERINDKLGKFTVVQFENLREKIRDKGFQENFDITHDYQANPS